MAANPPAQFVAPTDGMSGGGVLAGSMTTSGMPAPRSCPTCAPVSVVVTRITPSEWWLAIAEVQLAGPRVTVPHGGHRDRGRMLGAPLLDAT